MIAIQGIHLNPSRWQALPVLQPSAPLAFGQASDVSKPHAPTPPIILGATGYFAPELEFEKHYEPIVKGLADVWIARMNRLGKRLPVLVAWDGSSLSESYLPRVVQALTARKLDVYTHYVAPWKDLPMPLGYLSLFLKHFHKFNEPTKDAIGGIMLTAGSRPRHMAGMRFLTQDGRLFNRNEITDLMTRANTPQAECWSDALLSAVANNDGQHKRYDFMQGHYGEQLDKLADAPLVKDAKLLPFYDAQGGAGQNEFHKQSLGFTQRVYTFNDKYSQNQSDFTPERNGAPNKLNMSIMQSAMRRKGLEAQVGLINNADNSTCRVLDEKGRLLSPGDFAALLLRHYIEYRGQKGRLIKTQDCSTLLDEIAAHYGLPVTTVPVGGTYLSDAVANSKDTVLLGVDGQGGFILPEHVPVKDGFLLNFMAMAVKAALMKTSPVFKDVDMALCLKSIKEERRFKYQQSHFSFRVSKPNRVLRYFERMITRSVAVNGLAFNKEQTQQWQRVMRGTYGVQNQFKLFYGEASSVLLRQSDANPQRFDVFIESATRQGVLANATRAFHKQFDLDTLERHVQNLLKTELGVADKRFNKLA